MVRWRKDFLGISNSATCPAAAREWQVSVDLIYRCLTAKLIAIINCERYSNTDELLDDLRRCDPFAMGKGGLPWNGVFIYGTKALEMIVERFFRSDDEYDASVNSGFISAIEKAFEDAGVPYSDTPLMPVLPSA
jgi:hypothetical protein